jgi:hypothetical protein
MPMSEKETIYISLLNEGTTVWCPVKAIRKSKNIFMIPEETEKPDDEDWEFSPGTLVKCQEKVFSSGERGLVAYELG